MIRQLRRTLYDYVVVGSGPGACAWVANHVRRGCQGSILVIEQGPLVPEDVLALRNPVTSYILSRKVLRAYKDAGPGHVQGTCVGGGSAVNAYQWISPSRYDLREAFGRQGLEVLPQFAGVQNALAHEFIPSQLHKSILSAPGDTGISIFPDHATIGGVAEDHAATAPRPMLSFNPSENDRVSAYNALVAPLLQEPCAAQLDVMPNARARRLIFSSSGEGEAVELERPGGEIEVVHAAQAVVLGAGAIETPALLMRSGVGPEATLARYSIPVRHANEKVGRGLQDKLYADEVAFLNERYYSEEAPFACHIYAPVTLAADGSERRDGVEIQTYQKSSVAMAYMALQRLQAGGALAKSLKYLSPRTCLSVQLKLQAGASAVVTLGAQKQAHIDYRPIWQEVQTHAADYRRRMEKLYSLLQDMSGGAFSYDFACQRKILDPQTPRASLRPGLHYTSTCAIGKVVREEDCGVIGVKRVHICDNSIPAACSTGNTQALAYYSGLFCSERMWESSVR